MQGMDIERWKHSNWDINFIPKVSLMFLFLMDKFALVEILLDIFQCYFTYILSYVIFKRNLVLGELNRNMDI